MHFAGVQDFEVSPRYRYGELRLKRLNFWAKIFLHHFFFHKVQAHYAYGTYFSRFYAPVWFIFAFCTVVLSAMQVELATSPDGDTSVAWSVFRDIERCFCVAVIGIALLIILFVLALFTLMGLRELVFALKMGWETRSLNEELNKGSA